MTYVSPWAKETGILRVTVGGYTYNLPDPASMDYQVYDLDVEDSTGRGLDGNMLRDRVAVKEKLVITFPPLYAEDITTILGLIADQFFTCTYWSLKTGGFRTATMYAGDRSAKAYYLHDDDDEDMWTEFSVNFIER